MTITAPMCQKIWQNLIAEIPLQPSDVTAVKFSTKELAMCAAKYGVCVKIRRYPVPLPIIAHRLSPDKGTIDNETDNHTK